MRETHVLCILVFLVFISGCISGQNNYTPPKVYKAANSLAVDAPKDEVWKQLVKCLGSEFFVINNMDKESGFVNVSYSGDPMEYIDGGEIRCTVKNLAGKREYKFRAASPYARYESLGDDGITLFTCERRVDLEGRINIIVSEEDDSRTNVTVNTRYIITQKNSGQAASGQVFTLEPQVLSMNTGGSVTNSGGTTYRATGKLEEKILSCVKQ